MRKSYQKQEIRFPLIHLLTFAELPLGVGVAEDIPESVVHHGDENVKQDDDDDEIVEEDDSIAHELGRLVRGFLQQLVASSVRAVGQLRQLGL